VSHQMPHGQERTTGAERPGGSERTIGQLVADASHDLSTLLRAEVALAKAELKVEAKQAALGAGLFAGAAVFGLLAVIMVLFAVANALDLVMPAWLAFLIVAVLLLAMAGLLALVGKTRISKVGPPQRTIDTSKQSIEALKGHR
jgi:Putative Actinobacterial Holin-X, holin superfamily III